MKLPQDIMDAVIKATAKELADRLAGSLDELQLFTIQDCADRLRLGKTRTRELIKEYVDLGDPRVTPATLRKLIADRSIGG